MSETTLEYQHRHDPQYKWCRFSKDGYARGNEPFGRVLVMKTPASRIKIELKNNPAILRVNEKQGLFYIQIVRSGFQREYEVTNNSSQIENRPTKGRVRVRTTHSLNIVNLQKGKAMSRHKKHKRHKIY